MIRISRDNLEAILVAVLSVNRYGADRAWKILPDLREAGVADPRTVTRLSLDDLTALLINAGYNRGPLNEMMATRVRLLMEAAAGGELDPYDDLVAADQKDEAARLLRSIYGIGNWAANLAWDLRSRT